MFSHHRSLPPPRLYTLAGCYIIRNGKEGVCRQLSILHGFPLSFVPPVSRKIISFSHVQLHYHGSINLPSPLRKLGESCPRYLFRPALSPTLRIFEEEGTNRSRPSEANPVQMRRLKERGEEEKGKEGGGIKFLERKKEREGKRRKGTTRRVFSFFRNFSTAEGRKSRCFFGQKRYETVKFRI